MKKIVLKTIGVLLVILMFVPQSWAATIVDYEQKAKDDVSNTLKDAKEYLEASNKPSQFEDQPLFFPGDTLECKSLEDHYEFLKEKEEESLSEAARLKKIWENYQVRYDSGETLTDEEYAEVGVVSQNTKASLKAVNIYLDAKKDILENYLKICNQGLSCPENTHPKTGLSATLCECDSGYNFDSATVSCVRESNSRNQIEDSVDGTFQDVSTSHKNRAAIQYLYDHQVISGYPDGSFQPEKTLNRAELLKILVGGKGIDPSVADYKNCFPDVQEQWFAPFVCYAKQEGWVAGYPDGTFQPGKTVNKVEAIKMFVNSQGFVVPSSVSEVLYDDVDNSQWFAPYLKVAKDKGLLEEKGSTFSVSGEMKRAGISENIYRAMIINEQGISRYGGSTINSETEETSDTPTPVEEEESSGNINTGITEEAKQNEPIKVSGSGTNVSDRFTLEEGLVTVTMNYEGSSNFIVTLLDSNGERVEGLANEIGDFKGNTALNIRESGEYLLNVKAEGSWSFQIEQPKSNNAPSTASFTGKGIVVSDFFQVKEGGLVVFSFDHDGESNFQVQVLDKDGNVEIYVENEIGKTNGSIADYLDAGIYLLRVNADGNWNVRYEYPDSSNVQKTTSFTGKGKTATQLFRANKGLATFKMTHNGSSNFIVELFDKEGYRKGSLSNEIGVFSGSTAESLDDDIYILNVDADGDWTIEIEQ